MLLFLSLWQGGLSFFAYISEGGRFEGVVVVEVSGVCRDGVMTSLAQQASNGGKAHKVVA